LECNPLAKAPEAEPADFETTLMEVEAVVRKLESGELKLDVALEQYESAVGKMRQCYKLLEAAERKISVLSGFDAEGNPVLAPLEHSEEDESLIEKQKSRGKRRGVAGDD